MKLTRIKILAALLLPIHLVTFSWMPSGSAAVLYTYNYHETDGSCPPEDPNCIENPLGGAHARTSTLIDGQPHEVLRYDTNGNLVEINGGETRFFYNLNNRLIKVQTQGNGVVAEYFDGPGLEGMASRSYAPMTRTTRHYTKHFKTVEEGVSPVGYTSYFANGQRVAMRASDTGELKFSFGDHLGSTAAVVGANTVAVLERQDFMPFGTTRVSSPSVVETVYGFNGNEKRAEGLYDYGARTLSSDQSLFTTPDSVVPQQGNPQTLNRYAYVNNNPLKYTDPSGHFPLAFMFAMAFINVYMNRDNINGLGDLLGVAAIGLASGIAGPGIAGAFLGGLTRGVGNSVLLTGEINLGYVLGSTMQSTFAAGMGTIAGGVGGAVPLGEGFLAGPGEAAIGGVIAGLMYAGAAAASGDKSQSVGEQIASSVVSSMVMYAANYPAKKRRQGAIKDIDGNIESVDVDGNGTGSVSITYDAKKYAQSSLMQMVSTAGSQALLAHWRGDDVPVAGIVSNLGAMASNHNSVLGPAMMTDASGNRVLGAKVTVTHDNVPFPNISLDPELLSRIAKAAR